MWVYDSRQAEIACASLFPDTHWHLVAPYRTALKNSLQSAHRGSSTARSGVATPRKSKRPELRFDDWQDELNIFAAARAAGVDSKVVTFEAPPSAEDGQMQGAQAWLLVDDGFNEDVEEADWDFCDRKSYSDALKSLLKVTSFPKAVQPERAAGKRLAAGANKPVAVAALEAAGFDYKYENAKAYSRSTTKTRGQMARKEKRLRKQIR